MRRETIHSMLRRCTGWDYRQPAIYMITLVAADRRAEPLGRLALPSQAQDGDPALPRGAQNVVPGAEAPGVALSPAGEAVRREFLAIGARHPEIKPLFIQVMPDHVHFIIHVTRPLPRPLGQVIAGFKAGASKAATGKPGFWAAGFQDSILFHEGQLPAMFAYLKDNPRRLAVKRANPLLFRVVRRLEVNLALPSQALRSVPGTAVPGLFSALGNTALLRRPARAQVQVSRRDFAYRRVPKPGGGMKIDRAAAPASTPAFEKKRDELLAVAAHGAVLVSPCISDGEREIARLAHEAGAAVIALRNKGFAPLEKPAGKLFDAAAAGRLLVLAPIAWPYTPAEKPMTRQDACVLNRIAQLICGEGAAEINYKGIAPAGIDRLVEEAVNPALPSGARNGVPGTEVRPVPGAAAPGRKEFAP